MFKKLPLPNPPIYAQINNKLSAQQHRTFATAEMCVATNMRRFVLWHCGL
jgi:hypothetical protein